MIGRENEEESSWSGFVLKSLPFCGHMVTHKDDDVIPKLSGVMSMKSCNVM